VLTPCSSTRKWEVVFVAPGSPDRWIRIPTIQRRRSSVGISTPVDAAAVAAEVEKDEPLDPKSLPEGDPEIEIEGLIIPAVKDLHVKYIEAYRKREAGRR
jgi:phosphopantothenate---cysteine ligase (ATP)